MNMKAIIKVVNIIDQESFQIGVDDCLLVNTPEQ